VPTVLISFFVELSMTSAVLSVVVRAARASVCALAFGMAAIVSTLPAQAPARATPLQTMEREARVSKEVARRTALAKVPGGRMSSIELRRGAGGKLVYNASIAVPGQTAKTEVVVDAMTGAVISKRP
jgi:predicted aspartyl protease